MRSLENFKVILWDFDGVIMDSMPIRDEGFRFVLSEYPKDQVDDLMEYHQNNGGLSRYNKFRYFFEGIRKESITEVEIEEFASKFSDFMLKRLLNEDLLINDTVNFIRKKALDYRMHIVSGSDQNELRIICEALNLEQYFISIHGSPTPKNELVKNLLKTNEYNPIAVVLIGDSHNDLDAAKQNGIDFIGYNNPKLSIKNQYIVSFS
jgi:phosphoglycolate phosphatase-like HAD superfamily hydrolase